MKLTIVALALLALGLVLPAWLFLDVYNDAEAEAGAGNVESLTARSYTAEDSSGKDHHGVVQGSTLVGLEGYEGKAYSFVRRGSWVLVFSRQDLNPGESDFVVSAWVNFADVPGVDETYDIVRKGVAYTPTGDFKLEIVDPGGVRCTVKDARRQEERVTTYDVDVSDGKWHHIACARTGSMVSVIADDFIESKKSHLGSVGNTMPLAIGSKYGWEDQSNGRVDEISLYISDGAASPDTPSEVRAAIASMREKEAAGIWHFDEEW